MTATHAQRACVCESYDIIVVFHSRDDSAEATADGLDCAKASVPHFSLVLQSQTVLFTFEADS